MNAQTLYDLLVARAAVAGRVEQVLLGLSWSQATVRLDSGAGTGLCFSPLDAARTLPWSGTLRGRPLAELCPWLLHWHACEAAVGAAVINASINARARCRLRARPLQPQGPAHLAVFEHFAPLLQGARVAVIGRYPGLQAPAGVAELVCIERRPGADDLPDAAADFILPRMDWVFITASSIANKTLPHLLQRSQRAQVVLMGPSLPWLEEWGDFGVNYLAGVNIHDPARLQDVIAEGGGTRIFGAPLGYAVLAL